MHCKKKKQGMKQLVQYNRETLNLFTQYLNNRIQIDAFIAGLLEIENYHRLWIQDTKHRKVMWYRFHSEDLNATMIHEIKDALLDPIEAPHMRSQLNMACSKQEIQIFYS